MGLLPFNIQWTDLVLPSLTIIFALSVGVLVAFIPSYQILSPLNQRKKDIYLDVSPNRLSAFDIDIMLLLFGLRSANQAIFGPPEAKTQDAETDISLSMPLLAGPGDVRDYAEAAMDGDIPDVPPPGHLLLMMLCISEPTMILVLGKRDCPILPLGSVNVRNRIELLDPERCHLVLKTKITENLTSKATLLRSSRQVKRGKEYDIRLEILTPDETGTKDICIFRLTFTMLQFSKALYPSSKATTTTNETSEEEQTSVTTRDTSSLTWFKLALDDPWKWAIACKDYNPIHTYTFAAKLFGFPGRIAHGNHVVAKALHAITLARLDTNVMTKMNKLWFNEHSKPIWMEVTFKRPVVVPNELQVRNMETEKAVGKEVGLDIYKEDKVYTEVRSGFL